MHHDRIGHDGNCTQRASLNHRVAPHPSIVRCFQLVRYEPVVSFVVFNLALPGVTLLCI
jgi:hypothetical protein